MSAFLRWPNEDPRTTPTGHAWIASEAGQIVPVKLDDGSGLVDNAHPAREYLAEGEPVIRRGLFWEKA